MNNWRHNNLLIIADDIGIHELINEGIIDLLKSKSITGASLMSNGEAFEDAVNKCLEIETPKIGIHLTLVREKPVSQISEISSLVTKNGYLHKDHKTFFKKYLLGFIDRKEIDIEMRSQIAKCVKAGIKPVFLNGDQHLHLIPGVLDIVINLAKEYDIPYIRIVNEPLSLRNGKLFRQAQLLILNLLSRHAKRKIIKAGLKCNDFFIGFIDAGNLSNKNIEQARNLSEKYPNKIVELGCHPGFEDDQLRIKYVSWGNYNWQKESNLLKNYKYNE